MGYGSFSASLITASATIGGVVVTQTWQTRRELAVASLTQIRVRRDNLRRVYLGVIQSALVVEQLIDGLYYDRAFSGSEVWSVKTVAALDTQLAILRPAVAELLLETDVEAVTQPTMKLLRDVDSLATNIMIDMEIGVENIDLVETRQTVFETTKHLQDEMNAHLATFDFALQSLAHPPRFRLIK